MVVLVLFGVIASAVVLLAVGVGILNMHDTDLLKMHPPDDEQDHFL